MTKEAFLLCGGKARRFGSDKRFIKIKGQPLYLYQLDKLRASFESVTLLCKESDRILFASSGVTVVAEPERETSLLCGIIEGLKNAKSASAVFLSVDMPLLPVEAIKFFRDYPVEDRPVIPFVDNRFHPGFSIFPKSSLQKLIPFLCSGIYVFKSILPTLDPVLLHENELPFLTLQKDALFNINTLEDFYRFQEQYPGYEPKI